ncbi:MFS transporter [Clostridium boliviensis]|uniref:MFS transporter n=1 Tax=Clostridium boliviensis TaxID=318465 RepID=A0ABU4GIY5_9CLOT|nr:MFS transporter [Clostridium boliviensis]MDW2797583.1 MFS transporter [Clostridium boliviensis]
MDSKSKNKLIMILGLMAFLANGDNYAAAPLIINISKDLNISVSTAAISVTAYMLAFGVFTLIFGPVSDRYGKVKIINIAAIGTSVFSILGAFAFNLPSLIFFRAMNGAFGAGIFPVTMALVGQSFDDKNRHKALGKVMGLMFLGAATASAIGGALSYFGSWRLVYLIYGIGEFVLSIIMLKILERDKPVVETLDFVKAYKEPLTNFKFMRIVLIVFFLGFSVFGSFTYSGTLIQEITGYNILIVGLVLSLFGVGTVIGGRMAPKLKAKLKNGFLVLAGLIGATSLYALSTVTNAWLLGLALFGFGLAFIFLQSTLISTAQEQLPKMRGTAMSLTSFNMFVGGAVGTSLNGMIIRTYGASRIFLVTAVLLLVVSMFAAFFVAKFEMSKMKSTLQSN